MSRTAPLEAGTDAAARPRRPSGVGGRSVAGWYAERVRIDGMGKENRVMSQRGDAGESRDDTTTSRDSVEGGRVLSRAVHDRHVRPSCRPPYYAAPSPGAGHVATPPARATSLVDTGFRLTLVASDNRVRPWRAALANCACLSPLPRPSPKRTRPSACELRCRDELWWHDTVPVTEQRNHAAAVLDPARYTTHETTMKGSRGSLSRPRG